MKTAKNDTAAERREAPLRVQATRDGYYDLVRRRVGDVFDVAHPSIEFSDRWMERVDQQTPLKVTTGAQHLRQVHEEVLGQKIVDRGGTPTGDRRVLGE